MNDKKEAAKAGLDEVYSKKLERLEKIKEMYPIEMNSIIVYWPSSNVVV